MTDLQFTTTHSRQVLKALNGYEMMEVLDMITNSNFIIGEAVETKNNNWDISAIYRTSNGLSWGALIHLWGNSDRPNIRTWVGFGNHVEEMKKYGKVWFESHAEAVLTAYRAGLIVTEER